MAHRKRKAHRAASAAPRRRRRRPVTARRRRTGRRYSRNPFGFSLGAKPAISYSPKSLLSTATHGAIDGLSGVAGKTIARLGRGRLNIDGNTIKGSAVEILIGMGTAPLLARFLGQDVARAYIQGVFMGPMETAIKSAHVPFIAPALGDEGVLPLFGGLYDLGGTYDLNQLQAAGGAAATARLGDVGDSGDLAGEDAGMM